MQCWLDPEQMAAVAGYIQRNWGDGYTITVITSPKPRVSVFEMLFGDGARVHIAADKWGNCEQVPEAGPERDAAIQRISDKAKGV